MLIVLVLDLSIYVSYVFYAVQSTLADVRHAGVNSPYRLPVSACSPQHIYRKIVNQNSGMRCTDHDG